MKSDPRNLQTWKRARARLKGLPCRYCGRPSDEADHLVPVRAGGTSHPSNVVPACRSCNRSKGGRTVEEWRAAQAREPAWVSRTVFAQRRPTLRGDYTR